MFCETLRNRFSWMFSYWHYLSINWVYFYLSPVFRSGPLFNSITPLPKIKKKLCIIPRSVDLPQVKTSESSVNLCIICVLNYKRRWLCRIINIIWRTFKYFFFYELAKKERALNWKLHWYPKFFSYNVILIVSSKTLISNFEVWLASSKLLNIRFWSTEWAFMFIIIGFVHSVPVSPRVNNLPAHNHSIIYAQIWNQHSKNHVFLIVLGFPSLTFQYERTIIYNTK